MMVTRSAVTVSTVVLLLAGCTVDAPMKEQGTEPAVAGRAANCSSGL